MSAQIWSFVLGWSRVGINAALFLAATRVLDLAEIGLFATAFAPIRLSQGIHKAGISDAVIVLRRARRLNALFVLSAGSGAFISALMAILGALFSPMLIALSLIPLLNGTCAVSEGILRQRLALRTLALRTLAAQSTAATIAVWMLANGWGIWALAGFAVLNAALNCALSITLARWRPGTLPSWKNLTLIWPKTTEITGRILLSTSQLPLAQLAIGLTLGPVAAGAFQIATRMLELIDSLTLSPLRYIALPHLSRTADLGRDLRVHLWHSAGLAAWIWGGILVAAPDVLTLAVGPEHSPSATPVLRMLAFLGFQSAMLMPLTQALMAQGHTTLILKRAMLSLAMGTALLIPALFISVTVAAASLSIAAAITALWFTHRAVITLHLRIWDLSPALRPLLASVAMCAVLLVCQPMLLLPQIAFGTSIYLGVLTLSQRHQRRPA